MNWDDLRIAIAVHRTGTYAAAALALRMDESTVARRLARLERALGIPLFEAVGGQRRATSAGLGVLTAASRMAGAAEEIAGLGEAPEVITRKVRIATTDSVAVEILAPHATALLEAHPELTVHFLASTENVNFSRWEADIAIRLAKPERGDFIVSRLPDLTLTLVEPADGSSVVVCAYPEDLDRTPESVFLEAEGLKVSARCLTKHLLVIKRMIATGGACGVLPRSMSAEFRDHPRFRLRDLPVRREVWLLLQPHLREDPLVRAVVDWVRRTLAEALAE